MRIDCPCGERIKDQTDNLPHKGYVIPDQEWFGVIDAIEAEVIGPLLEGRLDKRIAQNLARHIIGRSHSTAYQCHRCGRLYILSPEGRELNCFVPESDQTNHEALRGQSNTA